MIGAPSSRWPGSFASAVALSGVTRGIGRQFRASPAFDDVVQLRNQSAIAMLKKFSIR